MLFRFWNWIKTVIFEKEPSLSPIFAEILVDGGIEAALEGATLEEVA